MTGAVPELFGPYRIEELLGRGGMGEVHRAYDTRHQRHVALKRLPGFAEQEFRARFRREAKLVAALDEPHVVRIHDHGEIDGQLYLDMALVDGPDLKRVLADGPLSPARTIEILTQVAKALDAAHAAGVLHRDVKPANILLDQTGNAYLADFGIARPLADDVTKLTNTGDYVGTLDYMAPERLMRDDADAASDVYSLACVLFQCLTGRVPFPAPDTVGKLAAQLNDPPPAPSLFDRRIPPAIDLVVRTGMDKDPKRRYPSAGELMAAAASITAESPTVVHRDVPKTGDHFVQLLMNFLRDQDKPPVRATDGCPYPGLQSFGVRDSDWFFGREQSVRDLLARLSRQRADDGPLIVVGASGAGKSSLLNAGLLAAQTRAGERALAMTPGDRPIGTLAARFAALTRTDAYQLAHRLWNRPGDFGELCRAAVGDAPLVVAVDQAEELFTQCRDPREREAFATALASAWPARVVVAVRADFVEHCITLPPLKPSLDAPYVLGPLSVGDLARVVTKPAEAAGLELEPGLVDRLITDVGAGHDPGALPRLAHALRETWHNRAGNRLTLNGYQRTGGVDRAVALTADGVYHRLAEPDRWALRAALLRMVTLLEGGGIAKRPASRAEMPPRILENLVAARLVTVDADTVSLSHDSLLTAWPRLRQWVEEDRQSLLVRQRLGEAAANWRAGGQDRGDLYRGARLAAALDWANERPDLTADERAFLQASDRDRRRTTRRLRGFVVGLATLLIVALVAGGVAVVAQANADQARAEAESRQLAAESLAESYVDPVGAMRDAVEGWHRSQTVEARGALLSATMLVYPSAFESGLPQAFTVDVNPDGSLVAVGSGEGKAMVWDVAANKPLDVDITGPGTVIALKFSPDGTKLAVSFNEPDDIQDSGMRVYSMPDGELLSRPRDLYPAIGALAWRPDGTAVAALSVRADEGVPAIGEWDPATGEVNRWIADVEVNIVSIAYNTNGDRIAVGRGDGTLQLFDPETGGLVSTNNEHARTAVIDTDGLVPVSMAFSAELMASASVSDNKIRIWDPKTGALLREFSDVTRHTTDVGQGPSSLAFSADGKVLYTNSDTSAISAWDPLSGLYTGTLNQGPGAGSSVGKTVVAIAVSKDGRTRVAATSSGTVFRWRTNANWLAAPISSVMGVAFAPDSGSAAAVDSGGDLMTWRVGADDQALETTRLPSAALGVQYARDGTRITGTLDATFTVTPPGGTGSRTIRHEGREFRGVMAISPDGKLFAAATRVPSRSFEDPEDHRITIWDVRTLAERAVLEIGDDEWPFEVVFSPDGTRLLAVTNNQGDGVYDPDTNGSTESSMLTWRVPGFRREAQVPLDTNSLITAVFTPDGRSIITAGTDGALQIRDARTGKLRGTFGEHTSGVRKLAISPDGRMLASVTQEDNTVQLWDLPNQRLRAVLTGHEGPLNDVAFSPDGSMLASGGTDTDVGVWPLDPAVAVRQVCANLADAGEKNLESIGC